ncbi:aldo/keto reductase [Yimella sp. cx-51]|uniref:aldo/keto reductase n=1 Tax=Yimella sp. cx-51 TaxID=2770551 RepID=UPI00165D8EF3|nr:aldo/keto reductase [Yimella sp. cx-51]MBC9955659.1 aldo/keto reductase [Yimella sp. cx-51]QTH37770.1 aldo/keto reductase [Yimella sp. cx-51]
MTTYTLNDGTTVPAIGFGTYPLKGDEGVTALVSALDTGYTYLDTAVNYENEAEVGKALADSDMPRDDVQIATKIPGRFHAKDLAAQSLRDSAERLGVDRIDVGLIHWPNPSVNLYLEAWQALVEAQQTGLVTTIGVSNFTADHLRRIIEATGVTPAINQIEVHPYLPQEEMLAVNKELGILTQAWSPLGKGQAPYEEEPVAAAAAAHNVTPAQVILRWHVQRAVMPLPKSATPSRQKENLEVFGFELDSSQMAAITGLGKPDGRLFGGDPNTHEEQ